MLKKRNQKGFTLIEIIAVLVILGILAAVAIPKYMDMQDEARTKSATAAVSEIKARASATYANMLLNGTTATIAAVNTAMNYNVGADYTLTGTVSGNNIAISVTAVQGKTLTAAVADNWVLPQ